MGVDHPGGSSDEPDLAVPVQVLPPSLPTIPGTASVEDLTQGGHRFRLGLGMHRKDRTEILERENAEFADLLEEAALGALGLLFLGGAAQSPAGVTLAACTTCGSRAVALSISVFADDGGAISASQTGSPGR